MINDGKERRREFHNIRSVIMYTAQASGGKVDLIEQLGGVYFPKEVDRKFFEPFLYEQITQS